MAASAAAHPVVRKHGKICSAGRGKSNDAAGGVDQGLSGLLHYTRPAHNTLVQSAQILGGRSHYHSSSDSSTRALVLDSRKHPMITCSDRANLSQPCPHLCPQHLLPQNDQGAARQSHAPNCPAGHCHHARRVLHTGGTHAYLQERKGRRRVLYSMLKLKEDCVEQGCNCNWDCC